METRLEGEAASGEGISRESKPHRSGPFGAVSRPRSTWVGGERGAPRVTLSWRNDHRLSLESAPLNPLQGAHPPLKTVWAARRGGSRLAEGCPCCRLRTQLGRQAAGASALPGPSPDEDGRAQRGSPDAARGSEPRWSCCPHTRGVRRRPRPQSGLATFSAAC